MDRFSFGKVARVTALIALASIKQTAWAQRPLQPADISPIDGEIYYLINQYSGLQAESSLPAGSNRVSQQPRTFTNVTQRWAVARTAVNTWEIKSVPTGACLKSTYASDGAVVLDECSRAGLASKWELIPQLTAII